MFLYGVRAQYNWSEKNRAQEEWIKKEEVCTEYTIWVYEINFCIVCCVMKLARWDAVLVGPF